jgi:hypothetical protein
MYYSCITTQLGKQNCDTYCKINNHSAVMDCQFYQINITYTQRKKVAHIFTFILYRNKLFVAEVRMYLKLMDVNSWSCRNIRFLVQYCIALTNIVHVPDPGKGVCADPVNGAAILGKGGPESQGGIKERQLSPDKGREKT